ncbi:MAG: hypothetical protein ABIQ08_15150 [Duganella sp.]
MQSKLAQLRASIDPVTPLFVLVDPMVGEPLPGIGIPVPGSDATDQRAQGWERDIVPVTLPKSIALPAHQHPYLIQLRGGDDPLLEVTFSIAGQERLEAQSGGLDGTGRAVHRIGGWLQSSMRWPELGARVAEMCRVNTEAATKATYLRVADRRVLDLLCHVGGQSRVVAQFGRLQSWTYLNVNGDLSRLQSPREQSERLRLSEQEWRRMYRGEMLHRTLAHYLGETAFTDAMIATPTYASAETALLSCADAARRWPHRFKSDVDDAVWAALAMWRPSINQLPAIRDLLDDPGSEDEPAEPVSFVHRDLITLIQRAEKKARFD